MIIPLVIKVKKTHKKRVLVDNEKADHKGFSCFNNKNYHNEYRKLIKKYLPYYKYAQVLTIYFLKVKNYIYSGNKINTPIGLFKIVKVYNGDVKRVSFAATNIRRRETGNPNELVYRDNPYYYSLSFYYNSFHDILRSYSFYNANYNNREIFRNNALYDKIIK